MIFQYTWQAVLNGQKTTTRRPRKPNEEAVTGPDGRIEAVVHGGRTKWQVGKTYAVQPGRNEPQIARIRVTGIRAERAGDISDEDARAEGEASREAFLELWQRIHGADTLDMPVWVVEFELVEAG